MKHSHPISVETFNMKDGNATTTAKTTDLVEINYCKIKRGKQSEDDT
jgi:hypothetical protein